MNNLDTLKAAIKRRGYAVLDRSDTEFPNMIILWIARDDGCPVETAPGIQRVVWRSDLELIVRDLGEHCDRMLASMSGGQQHMRCVQCDEPLLQEETHLHKKCLSVTWNEGMPKQASLRHEWGSLVKVYRLTRSGPLSNTLTRCPQCQAPLSEQTVQEIDDAARQLGEVMAGLEATHGANTQVQYVQSGARHEPMTIATWRERMEVWGRKGEGKAFSARKIYEAIPQVVYTHPVELCEDGREIWSRRTGQLLFKVLREEAQP